MNTSTKGSIGRLASRLMRRAQVGHARPILPRKQSNAESSARCMRELARKLRFQPQTRLEVFPRRNGGLYNVVWPWVASQSNSNTSIDSNEVILKDWQQPVFNNLTGSTLVCARSPRYCPDVTLTSDGDPQAMMVCIGRTHDSPLYSHGGSFHAPTETGRIITTGVERAQEARIALVRIFHKYGFDGEVPYPDIATKAKAQKFIGLDVDKLKKEKEEFKKNVLPEWEKKAEKRESGYQVKR